MTYYKFRGGKRVHILEEDRSLNPYVPESIPLMRCGLFEDPEYLIVVTSPRKSDLCKSCLRKQRGSDE